MAIQGNTLFFGDNLDIPQQHITDESVDLIHIDPPFNSKRNYKVLFSEQNVGDAHKKNNLF